MVFNNWRLCIFNRHRIDTFLVQGVDFTTHLYVPECDVITGMPIHERGDHNHIFKRIATSTREGQYQELDLQAFDDAMLDANTGQLLHLASKYMYIYCFLKSG